GTTELMTAGQPGSIDITSSKLLFASSYGSVRSVNVCTLSSCGGSQVLLSRATNSESIASLKLFGSTAYVGTASQLVTCPLAGCDGGTVLASGQSQVNWIAADTSGVYWITGNGGGGQLSACTSF